VLSAEQVAAIGEGARSFAVRATVNGETWAGRVTSRGGEFLLGMSRAVRDQVGAQAGDTVDVEIALDAAPAEIELPEALAAALAGDSAARAGFDGLAPSHRKEYARWIAEAKKDETRDRRVTQALERLREGRPRS
jgi:hypothetical protein